MDYSLSVDRAHLLLGLKMFKGRVRNPRSADTAVLGFDGHYLSIEVRGTMVLADASGVWPGNARVGAALIAALMRVPPPGDPVIVTCNGKQVQFGPVKVGCVWQPVSTALMKPPRHREWMEAIAIKYTLPRARIVADGLESEVRSAEDRLAALVQRAAKPLAPFGVTVADVQELVESRLEERYARRR